MNIPTNKWMNDPQYLAQVGHFLGGYGLIMTTWGCAYAITKSCMPAVFVVLVLGVIAASIKEFWYDMKYELPKQTWGDSIMDWCFYVLGGAAGVGIAELLTHLGR